MWESSGSECIFKSPNRSFQNLIHSEHNTIRRQSQIQEKHRKRAQSRDGMLTDFPKPWIPSGHHWWKIRPQVLCDQYEIDCRYLPSSLALCTDLIKMCRSIADDGIFLPLDVNVGGGSTIICLLGSSTVRDYYWLISMLNFYECHQPECRVISWDRILEVYDLPVELSDNESG